MANNNDDQAIKVLEDWLPFYFCSSYQQCWFLIFGYYLKYTSYRNVNFRGYTVKIRGECFQVSLKLLDDAKRWRLCVVERTTLKLQIYCVGEISSTAIHLQNSVSLAWTHTDLHWLLESTAFLKRIAQMVGVVNILRVALSAFKIHNIKRCLITAPF